MPRGSLRKKFSRNLSMYGREAGQEQFQFDGKTIDFTIPEIRVGNRIIPLTLMEAGLLHHLVHHLGKTVSRKSILEEVWGLHEDTDTRAIDNFIVRLRRYIEDIPAKPKFLLTVRGVGYRFVPKASQKARRNIESKVTSMRIL